MKTVKSIKVNYILSLKSYVFSIMIAVAVSGCSFSTPNDIDWGREVCMDLIGQLADDPTTVRVYSENYTINGDDVVWKLDVGTTNQYGGMGRKTFKLKTNKQASTISLIGPYSDLTMDVVGTHVEDASEKLDAEIERLQNKANEIDINTD